MPPPDLTARYVELANQLGEQLGKPHGWRRRVAEQLGIDESTLSKILSGKRVVGWDLADRAIERLKLSREYFSVKMSGKSTSVAVLTNPEFGKLITKFDAGTATTKDIYALANAVMGSAVVEQARSILETRPPKTEQQIGALYLAASRLIELLRAEQKRKFKETAP